MNLFENEDIEQFLTDPQFRSWVENPDESLDAYWQQWLVLHADQKEKLYLAREILLNLKAESLPLDEEREAHNIHRILNVVDRPRKKFPYAWVAAASIVFIFSMFLMNRPAKLSPESGNVTALTAEPAELKYVNEGTGIRMVSLEDGSAVLLQPNSSLTVSFSDSLRSVNLLGEAYFEIARNPERPFEVRTHHMTTRVLGTSFRVRDNNRDKPMVRVNTGKVTVSLNKTGERQAASGPEEETIILSPQEVVMVENAALTLLSPKENRTAAPVDLLPAEKIEHVYKRTPVTEVFDTLKKVYAVEISYDQEKLGNCSLTARLGDEPLAEKLRMICLGLNLTLHQLADNQFAITGNGCN